MWGSRTWSLWCGRQSKVVIFWKGKSWREKREKKKNLINIKASNQYFNSARLIFQGCFPTLTLTSGGWKPFFFIHEEEMFSVHLRALRLNTDILQWNTFSTSVCKKPRISWYWYPSPQRTKASLGDRVASGRAWEVPVRGGSLPSEPLGPTS